MNMTIYAQNYALPSNHFSKVNYTKWAITFDASRRSCQQIMKIWLRSKVRSKQSSSFSGVLCVPVTLLGETTVQQERLQGAVKIFFLNGTAVDIANI